MTTSSLPRVLLLTGFATWVVVCLSSILAAKLDWRLAAWSVASTLFIVSFVLNARGRSSSFALPVLQSIGVILMVALLCNGYEGLLLVLIAAQLALHGEQRMGLVVIGSQTLAMAVVIAFHWAPQAALLLTPPYLGFQLIMFAAIRLFVDERRASGKLGEAHATLLRLQAELAHKTRLEERLRIAQELHDVVGHHLTTLSLNLELAAHEPRDSSLVTIRSAQSLARALLRDVKTLAQSAADERPVDLQLELRQLAAELPRPKLHFVCAPDLPAPSAATSRALFRVVQEIVTNAIRHGAARNLWITIERTGDRLILVAHDDGEAATCVVEGLGLTGMRRRLEELGGTLNAASGPAGGFEVRAELPCARDEAA